MSPLVGTTALAARNLTKMRRNSASVIGAVVFPILFLVLFNTVLNRAMTGIGIDYVQYLPPAVTVQAMFFAAMSTAFYLTDDRASGVFARCRTLPIGRLSPLVARALADLTRAAVSLLVVLVVSMLLGFRFRAGVLPALGYGVLALGFALVLILGCGLVGLYAKNAETAVVLVEVPYLPVLMLSSAFVPADRFPDWLEPVVQASPITKVADALRALSGGGPTATVLPAALVWCIGLAVVFLVVGARRMKVAT